MTQTVDSHRGQKLAASGFGLPEFVHNGLVAGPAGQVPSQGTSSLLAAGAPDPLGIGTPAVDFPDAGEDLLAAVWRTSSYVESVQWELDAAQGSLCRAVQQAAHSGIAHDELCKAANMTAVELAAALEAFPVTAAP